MGSLSPVLVLALVLCTTRTTSGCSCSETFEQRVANAEFAAFVKVQSDEIPTNKGNYFEISKKCVFKSPYGTDVKRAYGTIRESNPLARTSCDGPLLENNEDYLIIGLLHDTNNADTDSVSYYGCGGYAAQWDKLHPGNKAYLRGLLMTENNQCLEMQS